MLTLHVKWDTYFCCQKEPPFFVTTLQLDKCQVVLLQWGTSVGVAWPGLAQWEGWCIYLGWGYRYMHCWCVHSHDSTLELDCFGSVCFHLGVFPQPPPLSMPCARCVVSEQFVLNGLVVCFLGGFTRHFIACSHFGANEWTNLFLCVSFRFLHFVKDILIFRGRAPCSSESWHGLYICPWRPWSFGRNQKYVGSMSFLLMLSKI